MIAFAAAIFLSAFLLFLVQPLLGRFILPWYGGTPAAWSVALLFFQTSLLAGYGYAHLLVKVRKPALQAVIHAAVLLAAALTLPVIPADSLKPASGDDPALSILWLLLRTVGLPFVALAATGPLLQAWMARVRPGKAPWIMYALSNIGSLGALLAYPFLIEPWFGRIEQATAWSIGFAVFAVLSALCGVLAIRRPPPTTDVEPAPPPGPARRAVWIVLSACGVWMLMAVTNRMSIDLAPVPFLWVLPLSLYLLSFVVTFAGEHTYRRGAAVVVLPLALSGLAYARTDSSGLGLEWCIVIFAAALFGLCWILHGELFRLRPDVSRLTGFYLSLSLGGALGGAFVGLIAPRILPMYWEYQLGQGLAVLAIFAAVAIDPSSPLRGLRPRWAWLLLGIAVLAWGDATRAAMRQELRHTLANTRSFFGVLRVYDEGDSRSLMHGTTTHGWQSIDPAQRNIPMSYYGPSSGIGRVMAAEGENRHIGVLGLGAGTLASWTHAGDTMRFYEIDPEVEHVARIWFWYLEDARGEVSIAIGDGRLELEREESQGFDVLALDAFSSDSIPVHLLTLEAFELYMRHLKPGGVLCVHITNRYVDLMPVVAQATKANGLHWTHIDDAGDGNDMMSTDWVLMSTDEDTIRKLGGHMNPVTKELRPWTDDYSNLFGVLK